MVLRQVDRARSAVARRLRTLSDRALNVRRPVILMYHRIAEVGFDPWGIAVAPDRFCEQLSWLARNRAVMPLSELARLHRRGKLPDDAVAVTFDDGYACTAKVATPLLERHDVPATIFLPVGLIGRTGSLWWDELAHIVMAHPGTNIVAGGRTFDIGEREDRDAIWPSDSRNRSPRQKGFYGLWAQVQPLRLEEIEKIMTELCAKHSRSSDGQAHRLMTRDEVRTIRSDNIEFGSHALTHASLPSLTAAEKAREIKDSVHACLELTGARPVSFAYPFGDYDEECQRLVGEAGYECACTIEESSVRPDSGLFALPRVQVGNWTARELAKTLHAL